MVASVPPTGPYVEGRRTRRLRPQHGFTRAEVAKIRSLKKQGHDVADIAAEMGAHQHRVEVALSALRTKRRDPDRFTLNVGDGAYQFTKSQKKGTEAFWQTADRLFTELQELRKKHKP